MSSGPSSLSLSCSLGSCSSHRARPFLTQAVSSCPPLGLEGSFLAFACLPPSQASGPNATSQTRPRSIPPEVFLPLNDTTMLIHYSLKASFLWYTFFNVLGPSSTPTPYQKPLEQRFSNSSSPSILTPK